MKYYLSFLLFALVTISVGCTTAPETVAKHDHHQNCKSAKTPKAQERTVAQLDQHEEPVTQDEAQFIRGALTELESDLSTATQTDDGAFSVMLSTASIRTFAALGVGATASVIAVKAFYRNLRRLMTRTGAVSLGASIVAGISYQYLQKKDPEGLRSVLVFSKESLTTLWNLIRIIRASIANGVVRNELGLLDLDD